MISSYIPIHLRFSSGESSELSPHNVNKEASSDSVDGHVSINNGSHSRDFKEIPDINDESHVKTRFMEKEGHKHVAAPSDAKSAGRTSRGEKESGNAEKCSKTSTEEKITSAQTRIQFKLLSEPLDPRSSPRLPISNTRLVLARSITANSTVRRRDNSKGNMTDIRPASREDFPGSKLNQRSANEDLMNKKTAGSHFELNSSKIPNTKSIIRLKPLQPPETSRPFHIRSVVAHKNEGTTSSRNEYIRAYKKYYILKESKIYQAPQMRKPGGWLTRAERKAISRTLVDFQSLGGATEVPYNDRGWAISPDIDWNSPNQLLDWEGKILPPPVEWDGRRPCERDNWCDFIFEYIRESQPWFVKSGGEAKYESCCVVDTNRELFRASENGEIAPRDWIVETVENQPLQSFWRFFFKIPPAPIDLEDVGDDPFWLRYVHGSSMLLPYDHGDFLCEPVTDSGETTEEQEAYRLWMRSKKQTSNLLIIEFLGKRREEGGERRYLQRKQKLVRRKAERKLKIVPPPNSNRPKVKIYLRPVNIKTDSQGVYDIYEHYANNTAYASELRAPELKEMIGRLHKIEATALPMIVAIEGSKLSKQRDPMSYRCVEKILGFAFANEDAGCRTQMSHVVNLETYVHKDYQKKGIGKTLLDRMLYLLDPLYHCVSDVPWEPPTDKPEFCTPGGGRVVGTLRIVLYYGVDERARCVWIREWLSRYEFQMEADFSRCGMKLNQWYLPTFSTELIIADPCQDASSHLPTSDWAPARSESRRAIISMRFRGMSRM
ncbi:uncharacterized protein PV09_04142 [Verruconis gallopava]|uniref:N-acetyltransferase domain-containing protein n=1 Tax=Verruconis gallopava TaxID=253628 RepID=A0A0D2AEW6_9PEZI|nr:uncharacterized protein PV09_04142 [Verruconis gallopava]KIW04980.1 hypothetical protein PV09_04142 [Verruconis gallopava]